MSTKDKLDICDKNINKTFDQQDDDIEKMNEKGKKVIGDHQ